MWDQGAWQAFTELLLPLFAPHPDGAEDDIAAFCGFVAEQKADLTDPERRSTKQVRFDELTLRLGSIHSVKGKSVDGILVVESEVWERQQRRRAVHRSYHSAIYQIKVDEKVNTTINVDNTPKLALIESFVEVIRSTNHIGYTRKDIISKEGVQSAIFKQTN